MIPYSPQWGACQRMYFLGEFLQKNGMDVYVLHSADKKYGNFEMPKNFHSIPISERYSLYSSINSSYNIKSKFQKFLFKFGKMVNKRVNVTKVENFIFNEPNPLMGSIGYLFFRNAKKRALKIVHEKSIDYVIVSAPPFSLFHFAQFLKKHKPEIKIIFDYRDPWNTPGNSKVIASLFERHLLKFPDFIVFVNEKICLDVAEKFKLPAEKCKVVLNGYSQEIWESFSNNWTRNEPLKINQRMGDRAEKMIISYVGSLSFTGKGYREISTFLSAFNEFQKDKKILLRIIGVNPLNGADKIQNSFPLRVDIIPPVNLIESLKLMMNSDVLLLLHTDANNSRYILTGKFFDYIRSGKVILGIAEGEAYFNELIKKHKLGVTCLNEVSSIKATLELLYEKWMNGNLGELRRDENLNIEELSREYQNNKYLKLLIN